MSRQPDIEITNPAYSGAILVTMAWVAASVVAVVVKHKADNPAYSGNTYDATATIVLVLVFALAATMIIGFWTWSAILATDPRFKPQSASMIARVTDTHGVDPPTL